jgi:two-component system sensor histidine kinase HydH
MALLGKEYLHRRLHIPYWLRLMVILGMVCLAFFAFMAVMDLDRESRNIEQLYTQRGELIIRSMGVALRQKWIIENSQQSMATFTLANENSDVIFVATSDHLGRIRGSSLPETILLGSDLGVPESPETFHPHWTPSFKKIRLGNGQKAFTVYRPFISSLEPPPPPKGHHTGQKKNTLPPPWPPEVDFSDLSRTIYCWVGFDIAPFELAEAAGRRSALIFSALIGLVLLSVLFAVSWSLKFMRNYAVTNEIITRLPVGLILNNPGGQVILANSSAEEITNLPEARLLGHTLKELTNGAFPDDPEMTSREMEVSFLGGPWLRLAITCGQIMGPGGEELGRVVLLADMGELSRLKDELIKQERLARLGGIASGLAHEIRNPLGAIKGLTQHLINKSPEGDEREALQVILNSVERLARTISDFQSFAILDIKNERVELNSFMKRLHGEMEEAAPDTAVGLELPDEPVAVQADPLQLADALKSICRNALQAMKQNPGDRPKRLDISLSGSGASAAIVFSDSGPGFGLEQLKTPFVPYFSSSAKHTGLGLAKANNVITAFNGSVGLANSPGGGAVVTVSLPKVFEMPRQLKLSQIDIGRFIRDIHAFMSYDSRFKGVAMTLDLPAQTPTVDGDRDMLTQALTNIYLNAIQAIQAGGRALGQGKIDVRLSLPDPGTIEIAFSDNGPGFKQSQLDKPFVPFFTTKSKGMGLGILIIRQIIEAHGGAVRLENTAQGGGRVVISLPMSQSGDGAKTGEG